MSSYQEQVNKAEHDLKSESEKFNLRLQESQKFFEECISEREAELRALKESVTKKDHDILTSENDLRQILEKHEKDVERIMSRGEVNIHDHILQMLEQKLKDTNALLDGKIETIALLQKDVTDKEKRLDESQLIQRSFREKLQTTSEQLMLLQANMVDMEMQWKEEKKG